MRIGRGEAGRAQLLGLGRRGDAEHGGAGLQRRPGHGHGAVPVAVGLDDSAEDGAVRQDAQRRRTL